MEVTNIDKARARIVLKYPFFASLLLRKPMVITKSVPTAAVDNAGTIYINPEFADTLSVENLVFVFAHEVMHVVYAHRLRAGDRDHEVWNIACDAVINVMLRDCGVGAPIEGCVLIDGVDEKSTAEEVYVKLMSQARQGKRLQGSGMNDLTDATPGDGKGSGEGDNSDGDKDGQASSSTGSKPTDEEIRKAIADGKQAIAQAYNAERMAGKGGGALQKYVAQALASNMPWHKIMEKYFHAKTEQRTQWTRPNKRYLDTAYMPRRARFPSMGRVVIGIDTSGSISDEEIAKFIGHLESIVESCHPEAVDVLYVTSEVEYTEHYENGDYPITPQENRWCGGTDMTEIIKWAEKNCPDADLVVVFSDGYTPYVHEGETALDVLWVLTERGGYEHECHVTGEVIFTEGK